MKPILAIDPGTTHSAWLRFYNGSPVDFGFVENEVLVAMIHKMWVEKCEIAIEMIASYGMPVGTEVFQTCVWIGRFTEAALQNQQVVTQVFRKDIKLHLCGTPRAKDANVRQSILDRFPRSGGGKVPQVGTKSQPGPLYGVSSHVWSALAVAVTYADTRKP